MKTDTRMKKAFVNRAYSSETSPRKFHATFLKLRLVVLTMLITSISSFACEVCKQQQPKILKGITHGAGPDSRWDYLIVGVTTAVVLATMYYSIKWLIKPGEQSNTHIKRIIFD